MNAKPINMLDKMHILLLEQMVVLHVCDQTPTVIYSCRDHIVTRGAQRLKDQKDIACIIFKVLTARCALILYEYEPYPKTRGPEYVKCLKSLLFSLTWGLLKQYKQCVLCTL
jgi:hypothetical protein